MATDPKQLVADGYDKIADAYLRRYEVSTVRDRWLNRLTETLPVQNARVLDLGCGAGIPVARELANRGHFVVGIDGSAQQITRASANVPEATFIQADMLKVELPQRHFDAVGAFYSITHIPATEQGELFKRVALWLKPGGFLVASLGTDRGGDWFGEWMGTRVFFSHNDKATSLALLHDAGLLVEQAEVQRQDNENTKFLWIVARKPRR
jgi:SAM-dependent methyltransferase